MLGIGSQKDDHRIELGVVELVDGTGRDVQQSVSAFLHQFAYGAQTDDARAACSHWSSASAILGPGVPIAINFYPKHN